MSKVTGLSRNDSVRFFLTTDGHPASRQSYAEARR